MVSIQPVVLNLGSHLHQPIHLFTSLITYIIHPEFEQNSICKVENYNKKKEEENRETVDVIEALDI